ncbi:MAG: DUF2157 domain-containing protein [bacterium]|nr:DUF2157 domain-containing protein [bacterium]
MNSSRQALNKAVKANIITELQAQQLSEFFKTIPNQSPQFNVTNVFYYLGGLIAIGAMTLFMNLAWELYGPAAILLLSLSYAIMGLSLAEHFRTKGYDIPAGICATFTICLTPLAIYAFQKIMGWWPDDSTYHDYHTYIKWNWIFMELGTLASGAILAWIYRYPFMIMPIAVTLWYMSMDLTSMISGSYDYELATNVSLYFGLSMILLAFWVDMRSTDSGDYAFWLYLFGVMAFWGGLSCHHSDSEYSKFLYLLINLILIAIGVILRRKVFVVFGSLGCCMYLGHLAFQVFSDSYLFPIALTIIGLGIIYLGILWQKYEDKLTYKLRSILPIALKNLLESRD